MRKRKNALALIGLSTALAVSSISVVNGEVLQTEKRGAPVTITLKNGEDVVADEFIVKVPKKLVVSKDHSTEYKVTASGHLVENHALNVIPSEKVTLTSTSNNITLESTVKQDKTSFNAEELEAFNEVETTGYISKIQRTDNDSLDDISGSYTGTMIFTISIDDGSTPEIVKYGLFNDDGSIIKSWDQLVADGDIKINGTTVNHCNTSLSGNLRIADGVTSIGSMTFQNCSNLTSVTVPDSVTSIGMNAFYSCSDLTSVTIPNSVTSIGSNAFYGVSNVNYNGTATGSPWGATYMNKYTEGDLVYEDSTKTKLLRCRKSTISAIIPDGVTSIGDSAFNDCSGLTSVTIPDSVTIIGEYAFYKCSNLTYVNIPGSVTSIGKNAFSACSSLTSVTIPNSVTSIGNGAFYNVLHIYYHGTATGSPWGAKCVNGYVEGDLVYEDSTKTKLLRCYKSARSVTIPNSVTSIGDNAFYECSNLISVTIPNSVTIIGKYAFYKCSNLTSVNIPGSVTSIGDNAFCNVPHIDYHGTAKGSPWGALSIN